MAIMSNITPQTLEVERQENDRWLDNRKRGIGGSDWASILDAGWGCQRALYYEKTGEDADTPDAPSTEMELGKELEAFAARNFVLDTGLPIVPHTTRGPFLLPKWWIGNPDCGVVVDKSGLVVPGEIKTLGDEGYEEIAMSGLPDKYLFQIHHYMQICGKSCGYFIVQSRTDHRRRMNFMVDRNDSVVEAMMGAGDHFWKHVEEKSGASTFTVHPSDDRRCQSCKHRRKCHGSLAERMARLPDSGDSTLVNLMGSLEDATETMLRYVALTARAKSIDGQLEEVKKRVKGLAIATGGGQRTKFASKGVGSVSVFPSIRETVDKDSLIDELGLEAVRKHIRRSATVSCRITPSKEIKSRYEDEQQ